MVFRRSIRTLIPTLTDALGINDFVEKARIRKNILDTKQTILYDRDSKWLQPLKEVMHVWVQNPETKKMGWHGRDLTRARKRTYKHKMNHGKVAHRNRKRIRRHQTSPNVEINQTDKKDEAQDIVHNYDKIPTIRRSKRIDDKKKHSNNNFLLTLKSFVKKVCSILYYRNDDFNQICILLYSYILATLTI